MDGVAGGLSLQDAYALSLKSAPEVALARYSVDGAAASKDVALGGILPQVSVFGQWSKNEVKYESQLYSQNRNYPGERYGIQFSQALLNVPDGIEALRRDLLYEQSLDELDVAEAELLSNLVKSYLGVLWADLQLAAFESELDALEVSLSQALALQEKNLVPINQVFELQARVDSLKADVILAEGEVEIALEALSKLTLVRESHPLPVSDTISLIGHYATADEAATAAIANSPAVSVAETAMEAAKRGVDKERGRWIPTVDLRYNFQYSDVGFDNLVSPPRDTSTISVNINYPLFEGGARAAKLRGAWAEYYAAQTRLDAQKRESASRARAAWLKLEASSSRIEASRKAENSAGINLESAQTAFKLGASSVTDVVVALAQQTKAKRDAGIARFEYALAWVELELAVGANPESLSVVLSKALHN